MDKAIRVVLDGPIQVDHKAALLKAIERAQADPARCLSLINDTALWQLRQYLTRDPARECPKFRKALCVLIEDEERRRETDAPMETALWRTPTAPKNELAEAIQFAEREYRKWAPGDVIEDRAGGSLANAYPVAAFFHVVRQDLLNQCRKVGGIPPAPGSWMRYTPESLANLLGTSRLHDLLRDATKLGSVGLEWLADGTLDYLIRWLEEDRPGPRPFERALAALCRAENARRDLVFEGKPAEPVFFRIDEAIPAEHLEFALAWCSNEVLKARRLAIQHGGNDSWSIALFWYLAACEVLEQMRARKTMKH